MGRDRRGQSPLRWSALPRAAPPAVARRRADAAAGQSEGAQTVRQGRQRLLGLGCAGKGGAAELLQGFGFCLDLLAPVCVDCAPGLGTAGLGGDQHPALRHSPLGCCPYVIAIAFLQRYHRFGGRLLQGVWRRGQGRRDTGHPGGPGVSLPLEVLCAVESAVGHQVRRPVGGLEWPHGFGDDRPTVTPLVWPLRGFMNTGIPRGVPHSRPASRGSGQADDRGCSLA